MCKKRSCVIVLCRSVEHVPEDEHGSALLDTPEDAFRVLAPEL
jgi:hypothetical protein